jgi:hypothetical protein
MIVSTRVWTPFDEFELELDDVFPAEAAGAIMRVARDERTSRLFIGDLTFRSGLLQPIICH